MAFRLSNAINLQELLKLMQLEFLFFISTILSLIKKP